MSSTLHPNVLRWGCPKAMWQLRTRTRWWPASASTRWWPAGTVAPPNGTRWWPAGAVHEEGLHNPSGHIHVHNNTSYLDVHTPPTVHGTKGTKKRDGEIQDSEERDSEVQDSEERDNEVQDAEQIIHNHSCYIHVHNNTSDLDVHTPTTPTVHGTKERDGEVQDSEERDSEVQENAEQIFIPRHVTFMSTTQHQ